MASRVSKTSWEKNRRRCHGTRKVDKIGEGGGPLRVGVGLRVQEENKYKTACIRREAH